MRGKPCLKLEMGRQAFGNAKPVPRTAEPDSATSLPSPQPSRQEKEEAGKGAFTTAIMYNHFAVDELATARNHHQSFPSSSHSIRKKSNSTVSFSAEIKTLAYPSPKARQKWHGCAQNIPSAKSKSTRPSPSALSSNISAAADPVPLTPSQKSSQEFLRDRSYYMTRTSQSLRNTTTRKPNITKAQITTIKERNSTEG